MRKIVIAAIGLMSLVALTGLGNCLNTNPVDYLKDIFATKEGYDGITIYFVLADKNGSPTASDGKLDLSIRDSETSRVLYSISVPVKKSDFSEATIGLGAFQRETTLFNIGRISYLDMNNVPSDEYAKGDVEITFTTPDGKKLKGTETVYFN